MNFWLLILITILILIIAVLLIKIYFLQKSADEINEAFAEKIKNDTNTIIDISCRDRHMCRLAEDINIQLKKFRQEHIRFKQGDLQLKNAVTNISHDLRTPLTTICGYLELLKQEDKSPQTKKYLEIIEDRTQVLVQLTDELFRYSVVSSTLDNTKTEKVEINHILEESMSAHYALITQNKIIPDISITDIKIIRDINKKALLRIFQNVISNAVKYTDGDLNIILDDSGIITFSNHTAQLDKIQTEKLFDRFYTVKNAEKSTGLGLSIAKILTEQMNGKIWADYVDGILNIYINFQN